MACKVSAADSWRAIWLYSAGFSSTAFQMREWEQMRVGDPVNSRVGSVVDSSHGGMPNTRHTEKQVKSTNVSSNCYICTGISCDCWQDREVKKEGGGISIR